MRLVREIVVVEQDSETDHGYAEKDWVCDPWIRGAIELHCDGFRAGSELRNELDPPLNPADHRWGDSPSWRRIDEAE